MSRTEEEQERHEKSFLYKGWLELKWRMMGASRHNTLLEVTLEDGFHRFLEYGQHSREDARVHTFLETHLIKSEYDQLLRDTLDRLQGDDSDRRRKAGVYFWENFLKIQHGMHPDDVKLLKDYTEIMRTSLIGYDVPAHLPRPWDESSSKPSPEVRELVRHFDYTPGRGRGRD